MQILRNANFRFMKYKMIALGLSGILILIGVINMTVGKKISQGIDFAGGALVRVIFQTQVSVSDVRSALNNAGIANSRIQEIGESGREFMIRTMQDPETANQELESHEIVGRIVVSALRGEDEKLALEQGAVDLNAIDRRALTSLLGSSFPDQAEAVADRIVSLRISRESMGIIQDYTQLENLEGMTPEIIQYLKENTLLTRLAVLSKESVGPQVGKDLQRKATQAAIWALLGMLIYIGIRFKYAYGVSAILTLGHDLLVTMGIFSLTNRELNLPVIAAVLTLIGYSLNDTIVIFDRVRDNLKIMRKNKFEEIIDTSINQTLSRTIITSGTTFLTVLALFLFGGAVINDFAFVMMIGVIVGTYSSIYQSCTILYFWKKIFKPKKGMGK